MLPQKKAVVLSWLKDVQHIRELSQKYRLETVSGGQESILSRGPMHIYAAEITFP